MRAGRIVYNRAFVFVTPAFGDAVWNDATVIPAATHFIKYFEGVYTEDGREVETVELAALLEECDRRRFEPAGDYRGEVIADGPAFLSEGREMLFRTCLPVRLKGRPDWHMPAQRDVMSVWRTTELDPTRQPSFYHEGLARGWPSAGEKPRAVSSAGAARTGEAVPASGTRSRPPGPPDKPAAAPKMQAAPTSRQYRQQRGRHANDSCGNLRIGDHLAAL